MCGFRILTFNEGNSIKLLRVCFILHLICKFADITGVLGQLIPSILVSTFSYALDVKSLVQNCFRVHVKIVELS